MENSNLDSLINIALNKNAILTDVYMVGLVLRTLGLPREVDINKKDFYARLPDFCIQCGSVQTHYIPQGRITENCEYCFDWIKHKDKPYCKENFSQLLLALTAIMGYQEREIRYLILKQVQKKESMNHE